MSWDALVTPALGHSGPYVPGPSLDELMARHALAEVARPRARITVGPAQLTDRVATAVIAARDELLAGAPA